EGDVELVGPHLEAPGVGGYPGNLGVVQPVGGGEGQAGGVPTGVVAPALPSGPGEPAGAHQQQVTAADLGTVALGSDRCPQVLGRDGEPVGEFAVGADRSTDV